MLKTLKLWFIIIFLPLLNILPKVSCTTIALSPRYNGIRSFIYIDKIDIYSRSDNTSYASATCLNLSSVIWSPGFLSG